MSLVRRGSLEAVAGYAEHCGLLPGAEQRESSMSVSPLYQETILRRHLTIVIEAKTCSRC